MRQLRARDIGTGGPVAQGGFAEDDRAVGPTVEECRPAVRDGRFDGYLFGVFGDGGIGSRDRLAVVCGPQQFGDLERCVTGARLGQRLAGTQSSGRLGFLVQSSRS